MTGVHITSRRGTPSMRTQVLSGPGFVSYQGSKREKIGVRSIYVGVTPLASSKVSLGLFIYKMGLIMSVTSVT